MPTRSPARPRRAPPKRTAKVPRVKIIGRVVHYYDHIGVAIVELASPLKLGDAVTFKRASDEHTEEVGSMQIDHAPVAKARKGDTVGIKVSQEVHEGAFVVPA